MKEIYCGSGTEVLLNFTKNYIKVEGKKHAYTCHKIEITVGEQNIGTFDAINGKLKNVGSIYIKFECDETARYLIWIGADVKHPGGI